MRLCFTNFPPSSLILPHTDKDMATKRLAAVMQPYKAQNASIPLVFILDRLDKNTDANLDCSDASITFRALLAAGFTHAELFTAYHSICAQVPCACRLLCRT